MAIPFLFICSWFDDCRTRRSAAVIHIVPQSPYISYYDRRTITSLV